MPFTPTEDDVIFNFAAVHRTPGHEDHEYFETNIRGAENVVAFAAVDRTVHTEYIMTPDNKLVISRGRIAKPIVVNIDDIVAVRPVRGLLFVASHIVIEYGAGHFTSVQPADSEGFVKELKRRLQQSDSTIE